ncbi:amino acid permease/ SLC12A domain-containing protein [Pyronema domesticum]|nr:amino acid permease/ SLC12A domain-containing protein [Pyronema domesticum]
MAEKSETPPYGEEIESTRGGFSGFVDSFRQHPSQAASQKARAAATAAGGYDAEAAALNLAESPLSRKLKNRHLQMIAIGGSIGTGLFVGSGKALAGGGPASLLICFALIGAMLFSTVHALGELAVLFPVAGSFAAYSTRFLDPAWGFAMGWNYAMQWLIVLPLEIVAAAITVNYWDDKQTISPAVWVTIFWVLIVSINLFGVKGYGEAEFIFSLVKVIAVIGFIILGIILNVGGGPQGGYIGGRYWHDPGAFNGGFKGLCGVFVTAAFSFAGTELVGLAAAETANPRKSLPTAIKQVFWRITLFYIVSLTLVGLLVPYTEPRLLQEGSANAAASPFVIAIRNAGIKVLPSVMNTVIMIAVLSVGNSSVYGSSRTLAALAEQGQAPLIFAYVDRRGRPMAGIILSAVLGLLSYISVNKEAEGPAFMWMLAISGLSSIFTWGSICACHIRFRRGWKLQGHSLDELAFVSQPGVIGSYIGLVFNCLVLVAQFWTAMWPQGGKTTATGFFSSYLAVPIVIAFYIPYKIYYKTPFVRAKDMDLVTGRRELDLSAILAEERVERATWPAWKRWYKVFC